MHPLFALPIAYILGSIPTAVWVSKIYRKIDIREHGSRNAGLTNVIRVLGWKPAIPVIIMDLLKGFSSVFIARQLGGYDWLPIAAGLLAIIGHSFTCFAGFRGGKGVLTALGVFLALQPALALISFAFWGILFWATKYVSVASIGGMAMLSILSIVFYNLDLTDIYVLILSQLVAIFVIVKHRANMVRLWNGTENGFGSRRKND